MSWGRITCGCEDMVHREAQAAIGRRIFAGPHVAGGTNLYTFGASCGLVSIWSGVSEHRRSPRESVPPTGSQTKLWLLLVFALLLLIKLIFD